MIIGRNDPCWCGSEKKWKKCHYPKLPKLENRQLTAKEYMRKHQILIKSDKQIKGIRQSCKLAAQILKATCEMAKEGITTQEINDFAHKLHLEANAIPAPLHYGHPPFPKSICTSLNDVICHGIPDQNPLKNGDILNIDVTCILNGYYGDCSRMVIIGEATKEQQLVIDVSKECLLRSIDILKPGVPVSAIGDTIEKYATSQGCSVVYQFVGHGVGVDFHEPPQIHHNKNHCAIPLAAGMTFTIEPMINAGSPEAVVDTSDEWTARTEDGRSSAQWEHTILITKDGHEVLTLP